MVHNEILFRDFTVQKSYFENDFNPWPRRSVFQLVSGISLKEQDILENIAEHRLDYGWHSENNWKLAPACTIYGETVCTRGRKIWLPIHSIAPRISNQFPRSIANHKEPEIPGCRLERNTSRDSFQTDPPQTKPLPRATILPIFDYLRYRLVLNSL